MRLVGGGETACAPGLSCGDPLNTIQSILDIELPGCGLVNMEHDNAMIERSDLRLTVVGQLKITLTKFFSVLKPRNTLRPRLRTTCPPPRQATARQALLALNKRNLGCNYIAQPQDNKTFAEIAFNNMMDAFAIPNWRQVVATMPRVEPNMRDMIDWEVFQSDSTKRAMEKLDTNFVLQQVKQKIADFEFILKSAPKVATDDKPLRTYATVQTVMFHPKEVNAFFGPMVREIDRRFRSVLLPNVLYNKGKALEQIEKFLTANYASGLGNLIAENDFSDYDRSQAEVAYYLDMCLLKTFGLDPEALELWMRGHYKNSNFSPSLGIRIYLRYQRKSGDVTTAFGNTVLNMTALAWALRLHPSQVKAAMFLGDDSWLQLVDSPDLRKRVNGCAEEIGMRFNADAKTGYYETGYFCGYYVLDMGDRVKMVADPIKRAVKLGRWDVRETSALMENWISFKDLMRGYEDEAVQERLAVAVCERHRRINLKQAKALIEALNSIRLSYKEFCGLYETVPTQTEY